MPGTEIPWIPWIQMVKNEDSHKHVNIFSKLRLALKQSMYCLQPCAWYRRDSRSPRIQWIQIRQMNISSGCFLLRTKIAYKDKHFDRNTAVADSIHARKCGINHTCPNTAKHTHLEVYILKCFKKYTRPNPQQ